MIVERQITWSGCDHPHQVDWIKCPKCELARLRRALDNIKIRAYELNQREIHDMALEALSIQVVKS
jgi:hypothetical protein